ncbi:hypothetical protein N9P41_01045 [Pseudomonadales bacterium]|nr:hypothetical protein [Pseudomonadales bacterium]MDA9905612.1 hypothetical protein [Pseudomonadales bacterium]
MAPKRNGRSTLKWKRWLAENRQELINSGVPEEIYKNEMRWLRLLQEGVDYEKQWGPEMLRSDETKVLHALLEVNSGEFYVSALLSELEARFDQELKRSKT